MDDTVISYASFMCFVLLDVSAFVTVNVFLLQMLFVVDIFFNYCNFI